MRKTTQTLHITNNGLVFLIEIFNPIYTCGLRIVVLSVMVSQKCGFSLLFETDDVNLTILEFSSEL
jgi:hypothetical protein